MELVPFYISLGFIGLTLFTIGMFYRASNKNKGVILIVLVLALLQAVLSQKGFFWIPTHFLQELCSYCFLVWCAF